MDPWERVRAKHGGVTGVVPAAAPAASNRWLGRRPSAWLGLHGTAALPEMSDRKGTAVDRPVGSRWRSYSPVVRGRSHLTCPVHRKTRVWAPRAPAFSLLLIQETELLSIAAFSTTPRQTMTDSNHRAWLRTCRGAWGEYGATRAGAVRALAVVQCDSTRNRPGSTPSRERRIPQTGVYVPQPPRRNLIARVLVPGSGVSKQQNALLKRALPHSAQRSRPECSATRPLANGATPRAEGGAQLLDGRPGAGSCAGVVCGSCAGAARKGGGSCAKKLRELCGKATGARGGSYAS